MKNWLKKHIENIIYVCAALLVATSVLLLVLNLSNVINMSYWACLRPITVPAVLIGLAVFVLVLWRVMIETGNKLNRLWGLVFDE